MSAAPEGGHGEASDLGEFMEKVARSRPRRRSRPAPAIALG